MIHADGVTLPSQTKIYLSMYIHTYPKVINPNKPKTDTKGSEVNLLCTYVLYIHRGWTSCKHADRVNNNNNDKKTILPLDLASNSSTYHLPINPKPLSSWSLLSSFQSSSSTSSTPTNTSALPHPLSQPKVYIDSNLQSIKQPSQWNCTPPLRMTEPGLPTDDEFWNTVNR